MPTGRPLRRARRPSTTSASSPGCRRAAPATSAATTSLRSTGRRPATGRRADADLEAKDFVDGAPAAARSRAASPAPTAGSSTAAAWHAPVALDSRRRQLLPRRSGRGRHAPGRARPRRRPLHRPVRGRRRARHGQARVRRRGPRRRPAGHCRRALIDDPAATSPSTARYIVKPRFGGSSIGIEVVDDLATARGAGRGTTPHLRGGAVVEPYARRLDRPQRRGAHLPDAAALAPSRSRCASGGAILLLQREVRRRRGRHEARRELPAQIPAEVAEHDPQIAGRADRRARAVRGIARIDFLWDGDDALRQRDQHDPGLAVALPVDGERLAPRAGRRRPHLRGTRVRDHPLAQHRCQRPRPALRELDRVEAQLITSPADRADPEPHDEQPDEPVEQTSRRPRICWRYEYAIPTVRNARKP